MKLDYKMTNEQYHGNDTHYSSSQLKTILDDPEKFYEKYINKSIPSVPKRANALIVGDAFHTKILEPELYEKTYTHWTGGRKQGTAWNYFQDNNIGKTILGDLQQNEVDRLVDNVIKNESALPFITGGSPEVSLFTELEGVKIKVRADYLNMTQGYIQDLKSTKELPNYETIQKVIKSYKYDLSAALYFDAFNSYLEANDLPKMKDFIWIFSSKSYPKSQIFRASEKMLEAGREKYLEALVLIKKYEAEGWNFEKSIIDIDPLDAGSSDILW